MPNQTLAENTERLRSIGMLCECGAVLSAVTYTCVLGRHCPMATTPPAGWDVAETSVPLANLPDTKLLAERDKITSRIATYRQPGQPVRSEDLDELGAVMAEINRREDRATGEVPRVGKIAD